MFDSAEWDVQGVRAAIAAVLAEPVRYDSSSDTDLLSDLEAVEALGRLVDARRVEVAAEVERRSRKQLGEDGLAFRMGRRDAPDFIRVIARVGTREARKRVGLGSALASRVSLRGDVLPGRFPSVAAAVRAGELGLESARIVIDALQVTRKRADPEQHERAEAAMAESACETDPESMRVQVQEWKDWLDPDGVEPSSEEQHRQRAFTLGRVSTDGTTRFHGSMPLEDVALVKAALEAHRAQVAMIKTEPGGEDTEDLESEWVESEGERRTRTQRDYDTVFGLITAGIRSEQDGAGGSIRTPHEVIVHVTAEDAAARRGGGWAHGVAARLSIPVIEQAACSGGVRLLVTDSNGEALHLDRRTRLFSSAQKKTLAGRYGGCAWPGCTAPVGWTEAHHIAWYHRDAGPTDVDNGVLLCSHHHHVIHASNTTWRIVLHRREPYLVPKHWKGPPEQQHRMQHHPIRMHPPRPDDPWLGPQT